MNRGDAQGREMQALRKTKADLETPVDTLPVVFDGRTGARVSIDRELRNIVDDLRKPDQPPNNS